MALPKNDVPVFELTVPSTGKKAKFRVWLVKEQKNLLMAMQAGETEIINAISTAVDTCTFGALDVENMPNFDLEYIFLQIRSKSVGESVEMVVTCQHCEEESEYVLSLGDVQVHHHEGHTKKIMLSDTMGVIMRYPTAHELTHLNNNYSVDTVFSTICKCIETVFTGEELHDTKDEPEEEVIAFVDTLTTDQLDKIERFFKTMPEFKHKFVSTCPHCQKESEYTLEGIEAFFG